MKFKKLYITALLLIAPSHDFYPKENDSIIKETVSLGVNGAKLLTQVALLGKNSCKSIIKALNILLKQTNIAIKTLNKELQECPPETKQKLQNLKGKLISLEKTLIATLQG